MNWSGLGDGFIKGAGLVLDYKDRKKQRQLEEADQALRREMQQRQLDADVQRMREGFGFQADQGQKERDWRTGERTGAEAFQSGQAATERDWRTGERTGAEAFQGGQNDLNRAVETLIAGRKMQQEQELNAAAQAMQQQKLDWTKDPTNPQNVLTTEHAGYFKRGGAPDLPPLPNAQAALQSGMKGGPALPNADAAVQWARQNPNDPRAKQILQRLGLAQ